MRLKGKKPMKPFTTYMIQTGLFVVCALLSSNLHADNVSNSDTIKLTCEGEIYGFGYSKFKVSVFSHRGVTTGIAPTGLLTAYFSDIPPIVDFPLNCEFHQSGPSYCTGTVEWAITPILITPYAPDDGQYYYAGIFVTPRVGKHHQPHTLQGYLPCTASN